MSHGFLPWTSGQVVKAIPGIRNKEDPHGLGIRTGQGQEKSFLAIVSLKHLWDK